MSICAIIVTFYPDGDFLSNLRAIGEQVDKVIIFDNTPHEFRQILNFDGIQNLEIISNQANQGLGVAFNFGLNYAKKNGYRWLATFDQDSCPYPKMFDEMLLAWSSYPNKENVRILAPRYLDLESVKNVPIEEGPQGENLIEMMTVITSGSLICIDNLGSNQKFDEDFFIDCIDHDFCLKSIQRGELVLQIQSALLNHRLGNPIFHKVSKKVFVHTSNHQPFRHYYLTRNRLYLWVRYFYSFPRWVLIDMYSHFKLLLRIFIFEGQKLQKFSYMFRGILDFLKRKKGRLGA
jgi:rhamnosyltransferase